MIFSGSTASVAVRKFEGASSRTHDDSLATEEPLEIRLETSGGGPKPTQKTVSITMRTPGHDFELATGFLLTEGVLDPSLAYEAQLKDVRYCGPEQPHLGHSNVVKVVLNDGVSVNWTSLERNFYTTSSCGVCGKASIEALRLKDGAALAKLQVPGLEVPLTLIPRLPERLRAAQAVFDVTGGLHASGLFDGDGKLQVLREDVGRHNALDKAIGWAFQNGQLPLSRSVLVLSGRISFELVQKAAMAGLSVVVAVGAPSTLALQLAREARITLVGFVRGERFNVYHDEGRLR